MQEGPPALITHRLRQPGELRPAAIQVIDIAVWSRGPDDLRHGVGELSEPLLLLPHLGFGPLPLGDIPGEAASVDELAVPPQHAGVDQYFLDRAVLAPQAGRILGQLLPRLQPLEDVADHFLVDMELGDGATDVLFPAVAEHVQFGSVSPEDRSVRPDPVQPDGRILEEVGELLLASP